MDISVCLASVPILPVGVNQHDSPALSTESVVGSYRYIAIRVPVTAFQPTDRWMYRIWNSFPDTSCPPLQAVVAIHHNDITSDKAFVLISPQVRKIAANVLHLSDILGREENVDVRIFFPESVEIRSHPLLALQPCFPIKRGKVQHIRFSLHNISPRIVQDCLPETFLTSLGILAVSMDL